MQAVLGLDALAGDARADHLGKAVDVDGVHVEGLLDLGPHGVGPGLGAEDADLERGRARVAALAAELIEDRQHVGGRHRDDVGLEVGDQLNLPLGHAAGDGDGGEAEPLGAVVNTQAAGEKAVAVGVVQFHAGTPAGGADGARHHLAPGLDVGLGVADHGRLAGGAGGGVDAHDLFARSGEHARRDSWRAGRPWW